MSGDAPTSGSDESARSSKPPLGLDPETFFNLFGKTITAMPVRPSHLTFGESRSTPGFNRSTIVYFSGHGMSGAPVFGAGTEALGIFFPGIRTDDPSPGATPTLTEVYKQIINARSDSELARVRTREGLQRGIDDVRNDLAVLTAKVEARDHVRTAAPDETVRIRLVVRAVSFYVLLLMVLSLSTWWLSGFILVNPAVAMVVLVASVFLYWIGSRPKDIDG
jgi:hypothetical protein